MKVEIMWWRDNCEIVVFMQLGIPSLSKLLSLKLGTYAKQNCIFFHGTSRFVVAKKMCNVQTVLQT